jgi:hypothetical protein
MPVSSSHHRHGHVCLSCRANIFLLCFPFFSQLTSIFFSLQMSAYAFADSGYFTPRFAFPAMPMASDMYQPSVVHHEPKAVSIHVDGERKTFFCYGTEEKAQQVFCRAAPQQGCLCGRYRAKCALAVAGPKWKTHMHMWFVFCSKFWPRLCCRYKFPRHQFCDAAPDSFLSQRQSTVEQMAPTVVARLPRLRVWTG